MADPGPGTGPWRTGAGFIPALLTALAASLIYCFSTSLPVLVARSAAACWLRITWCRGSLRPQSGIADPEHLAGEAVAMLAEQVRDDVSDPVGYAQRVRLERHRVDGNAAPAQL